MTPSTAPEPWNKGQRVGQKSPFSRRQAQIVAAVLEESRQWRDLALFLTAVDTLLRAGNLLALRVRDIEAPDGTIRPRLTLTQHKTGKGVLAALTGRTRDALAQWIVSAGKTPDDFLFTRSRGDTAAPITRRHYGRLVKRWAAIAQVDPATVSTHSLRRTKAALIYAETKDLAAVRHLLGHATFGATAAYLNIDQAAAADLGSKFEI